MHALISYLILGHYSPVMPIGHLLAHKTIAKSHDIIDKLLTLNVVVFEGKSQTMQQSIQQGLGLDFPVKTSLRVNK